MILVGNAGRKPELQTLADGITVTRLALATTESYRLKDGTVQYNTEWHPVIAWRGLANIAVQFVQKGSLLYVEGRLRHRTYEDKSGQRKYITEIIADQLILLDKNANKQVNEPAEDTESETPLPF